MKRLLALAFSALFLVSCGDDKNGNDGNTGFPTDGLPLPEEKKGLLLINYVPPSGASIATEIPRLILADEYKGDLNTVNLVMPGNPIGSPAAQQLADNDGLTSITDMSLNNEDFSITPDFMSVVEEKLATRRVIASVAHKVTKNDTAWLIDSKVKFWVDTMAADRFKIETYFLANVPAYNYSSLGLDLRGPEVTDLIQKGDSLTTWLAPLPNLDSTSQVVKAGEEFVHQNIMLAAANPDSSFGIRISEYTPFGFQYFENDVVGTESTPIRNYFLRPNRDDDPDNDIEFIYTPSFLTVIWSVDPLTGSAEYLNSFVSQSTP